MTNMEKAEGKAAPEVKEKAPTWFLVMMTVMFCLAVGATATFFILAAFAHGHHGVALDHAAIISGIVAFVFLLILEGATD